MCSLQLHRVVYNDFSDKVLHGPKVQLQSLQPQQRCRVCLATSSSRVSSSLVLMHFGWCIPVWKHAQTFTQVGVKGQWPFCAYASSIPIPSKEIVNAVKTFAACSSASVLKVIRESHVFRQCAPAVGLMVFATWGLGPLLRIIHRTILQKEDRSWKESQMHYIIRSYVRPLLLWVGVIFMCRAFDPLVLSTEASQAIKQRFVNFVRSLSTVLAFAYCTASSIQQLQKVMLDQQDSQDSRSLGAQFVGKAVYTAIWIAAVCLFMELLGFSTQKWLTAGGLGTVLLTLAGREIFTNFLSSIMIHATRPFVLNEWIQTKIDGYEVSGTVEHVGWWSPTIVRGDDREAVHIPNHKFTVSVVRNLSQKSHWRIKTHFGISHLDVSKIPSIVADMRKVLAKNPQVEQRRLHRRVFFDNIDPENQALMVLVSCFVKTPHFEEYLRVKEIILLDLLKVISHHHAHLATPIRSVQRVLDDMESRSAPFRDMNRSAEAQGRPYLLIEASAVANGQRDAEQSANAKNGALHAKEDAAANDGSNAGLGSFGNESTPEAPLDSKVPSKHKPQLEGLDSMGLNSKDITLLGAAFEKPPANIPEGPVDSGPQGEKVSFKSTAEVASVRAEKVSSKVPDQVSQPPSVKFDKSHTRHAEQLSQSTGKKSEKPASKAAADPPIRDDKSSAAEAVSVRAEKVLSKVPDQVSQPAGVKFDKRHTRHAEQLSQSTGKKLEKPASKAAVDPDSVPMREDKSSAQEDLSETDLQAQQKADVDPWIDTRRPQVTLHGPSTPKSEMDRGLGGGSSSGTKAQVEGNLVLGVALDGPKRTLPLDNEMAPATEQKDLVGSLNDNSKNAVKERREG